MTTVCGYPGCNYDDSGHRPYARKRDGIPSVTTLSSMLDTGKARSFGWAASTIAAKLAVHQAEQWANLGTEACNHDTKNFCPACRYLRSAHDRAWKTKANLGSHIHHCALQWAAGEDVDEDETTKPYLDALERFHVEHRPTFQHLEFTVLYDTNGHQTYRGQSDFIAGITVNGQRKRGLVDIKTGGFYPTEQTLQLSAYRYATWLTRWFGTTEKKVGHMPQVDFVGVLMLGADGGFRLIELPADKAAHSQLLRLRDVWSFTKDMERWEKDRKERLKEREIA